jgi:PAS domain S-box-containing protein
MMTIDTRLGNGSMSVETLQDCWRESVQAIHNSPVAIPGRKPVKGQVKHTILRGYVIALFATLGAELMAYWTAPYVAQSPFVLFVFAVVVSAWFGGRGPGLLATLVGICATAYISYLPITPRTPTEFDKFLWLDLSVLLALLTNSLITLRKRGLDALVRLAEIVESSDDAIIGQDLNGTIKTWNSGAEKVYGYSAEQVKGRHTSILLPLERASQITENLEWVKRGEHLRFETEHVRKDGRRIEVSCVLSPITNAGRQVVGASLISRDITDSKRAQAERETLLASEQAARAQAEATTQRLTAVQTVTDAALAHLGMEDLLRELLSRIRELLAADFAMILLLNEDKKQAAVRASVGLQVNETVQIPIEAGIADRIVALTQPSTLADLSVAGSGWPLLHQTGGSLLSAPLRVEGRVIGMAQVSTDRPRRFTEDEVQLLQVAADRAALAIDHARLFNQASAAVDRLKMLSQRLMDAQEVERRTIARELHDEIGQALTAIKINLQVARRSLFNPEPLARSSQESHEGPGMDQVRSAGPSPDTPSDLPLVEESIALTERILQQVRSLSVELRPSVLDDLGLVSALRWYVDRTGQRAGIAAQFTAEVSERRPAPEIEIACFRVAQEALTNITRHAQARHVTVGLREGDGGLELSVGDDGVGFDVRAARERAVLGKSSGLLGMEERVLAVGGRIEIRSEPRRGTEIHATFPAVFA